MSEVKETAVVQEVTNQRIKDIQQEEDIRESRVLRDRSSSLTTKKKYQRKSVTKPFLRRQIDFFLHQHQAVMRRVLEVRKSMSLEGVILLIRSKNCQYKQFHQKSQRHLKEVHRLPSNRLDRTQVLNKSKYRLQRERE